MTPGARNAQRNWVRHLPAILGVALLVGARPGMRVADWCAGAGGKTLAVAMEMQNRGHIVACDVHDKRLDGAVKRLRRAGVHNVERHLIEAGDKWVKRRAEKFDRVLIDAPCTGTGTWRRNPDGRLRLTATDLAELMPKQAAILDTAARLVRPGGRLVYATCSLLREENEAQIEGFCARQPGFRVVPASAAWGLAAALPCPDPYLVLTPLRHGTDGFFAAVLEHHPATRGHPSDKDAGQNKELEHFPTRYPDSKRSENAPERAA